MVVTVIDFIFHISLFYQCIVAKIDADASKDIASQ